MTLADEHKEYEVLKNKYERLTFKVSISCAIILVLIDLMLMQSNHWSIIIGSVVTGGIIQLILETYKEILSSANIDLRDNINERYKISLVELSLNVLTMIMALWEYLNQIKVAWASGIFILYTFNCMIISKDRLIDYKNILKRNCAYVIKELPGNEVNDSPFERLTNIDNELNLLQTEYNKECKFLHKQLGEGLISDLSDAERNDLIYWKNIKIGVIDYTKYKYIVGVIKD